MIYKKMFSRLKEENVLKKQMKNPQETQDIEKKKNVLKM